MKPSFYYIQGPESKDILALNPIWSHIMDLMKAKYTIYMPVYALNITDAMGWIQNRLETVNPHKDYFFYIDTITSDIQIFHALKEADKHNPGMNFVESYGQGYYLLKITATLMSNKRASIHLVAREEEVK